MIGAVALILLMTWLCVLGTELAAHVQNGLILAQVASMLAFAVVAFVQVAQGDAATGAPEISLSWLNPFGAGGAALTGGLLLGVFAYWGWESAVNLTEETEDPASAPGKAGVLSTVILLVTYVGVAFALVANAGTDFLTENAEEEEFIFGAARHRHPRRLGLDRPAGRDHVGDRVDPDDDHPRVADRPVHGAAAGDPGGLRQGQPAVPHPRRLDLVGRGHRHHLVPGAELPQRERAVRLPHRAVPAHRVLLRPHRHRLRRSTSDGTCWRARRTCC